MSWTERQRRMLGAMGVRLWTPEVAQADPAVALAVAGAASARPAVSGAPAPPSRPLARPDPPIDVIAPAAPAVAIAAVEALAVRMTTSNPPVANPSTPARAPATRPASPDARQQLLVASSDPVLLERATAIANLAWSPLKEAVAACTACSLCTSRRQTVFGVGHARANWMIIGEAPGEQEDRSGEPFVGPAGQLLDQMLRAVGQSRHAPSGGDDADDEAGDPAHRVFIANTLKCRPPRNRNPEPEEMARCEPFLKRQLALVQPRLILAMGRFAVRQLLQTDEAIGKLRGRVHHYEGIPVVVTYHPAYLLRNLPDKAKAWEDLCFAKTL